MTHPAQVACLTAVGLLALCACASPEPDTAFWLRNMAVHHGYSDAEIAAALEVDATRVPDLLARHGVRRDERGATSGPPIVVLPYPGGRHPRIGFLDGAVDPHRDTKASVFLPWAGAGYVVVDLPEALWWVRDGEPELFYLAHTHIPTHWDKRGRRLERVDWQRDPSTGSLSSRRRMPDGIVFRAEAVPRARHVDMALTLHNGTDRKLTGLRTQICVLLKGAPEFAAQTNDNKVTDGAAIAVASSGDGRRWIATEWERARPNRNPRCPCMHSDPTFPDLAPGETATVRGRLGFFEAEHGIAAIHALRALRP